MTTLRAPPAADRALRQCESPLTAADAGDVSSGHEPGGLHVAQQAIKSDAAGPPAAQAVEPRTQLAVSEPAAGAVEQRQHELGVRQANPAVARQRGAADSASPA